MPISKTLPHNSKKQVACAGKCSAETQHSVLADIQDSDTAHYIHFYEHYQIIQCDGCQTISFRSSIFSSEDRYPISETEYEIDEKVELYPARGANSRGLGDDTAYLPAPIARLYDETRSALINASPVLTGIGLRALVESVCKENGVNEFNLKKNIDKLAETGVLNSSQQKILHLIRTLGNKAAHEVKPHTAEQLALAMDVVEHLLDGVYVMPKKIATVFKDAENSST